MKLARQGPTPGSVGDLSGLRLATPTAASRRAYRAQGVLRTPAILDCLIRKERIQAVRRALLALPERTMLILAMRFGIGPDDDQEYTLAEIGLELGLSKERIRQLQNEGLEQLRQHLEATEAA